MAGALPPLTLELNEKTCLLVDIQKFKYISQNIIQSYTIKLQNMHKNRIALNSI